MNIFTRSLLLLLFIGHFNTTNVMFSTKLKSLASKQAAIKKMAQRTYTTKQPTIQPIAPSTTSLWDKLSNWIFKPEKPILLQQIKTQKQHPAPPSIALMNIPQQPSAQLSIDTITNLSQAKNLLKNIENTELKKQQKKLSIATPQWQNLLQKTQQRIIWIKNNCFTKHNPDATHDNNIPEAIYNRITLFLNKAHINPSSINIRYQDTTHIDPFGHKVISVEGPTLEYALRPASEGSAITGYKPATITLHSQIVNTLSANELDTELQHAITHLTQGHNEQLKILNDATGTEQYTNYIQSAEGQQFIASLETTANFLAPIEDYETAKIVQQTFLEKAFDSALKAIKENRKKHGLENSETGLMVCAPPGIELEFLAELQSFEDIEKYFKIEREKILRQAGLNNDEIQAFENEIKENREWLKKNYFQTPIDGIFHDPTFAPETLEEIKTLLHNAGINPFSVEIINKTKEQIGSNTLASARNPIAFKIKNEPRKLMRNQTASLNFCQEKINEHTKEYMTWIISHEIGHLMRDHTNRNHIANTAITKGEGNIKTTRAGEKSPSSIIWDKAKEKLDTLNELEADTTYLMRNFNLTKIAHNEFLRQIATKKETDEWDSPIHMSINDDFHWSNKILQLHVKEKEKSIKIKRFTPDITRE